MASDQNRNNVEADVGTEASGEQRREDDTRTLATVVRSTPSVRVHADKVTEAEIIWVLKMVESNLSYNSSEDLVEVLQRMAPDSMVLKDMQLKRSKSMYVLCYGLYPYYLNQLVKRIKQSPTFTLGTDSATFKLHSLSKVVDIDIRQVSCLLEPIEYLC